MSNNCYESVSYTHLDVYKRQPCFSPFYVFKELDRFDCILIWHLELDIATPTIRTNLDGIFNSFIALYSIFRLIESYADWKSTKRW